MRGCFPLVKNKPKMLLRMACTSSEEETTVAVPVETELAAAAGSVGLS